MTAVNHYTETQIVDDIPKNYYGPEPFDVNFCLPVEDHFDQLESDRVKLVPFQPRLHARAFVEQLVAEDLETTQWIVMSTTFDEFLPSFERLFRRDTGQCTFAIVDKLRPDPAYPELHGGLAGMVSLAVDNPATLASEVGIITFPAYQATYVTTHAMGLLLKLTLDVAPKGLGLRRVQWCTHSQNQRSVHAAERLGFTKEGVLRWLRVLPERKEGNGISLREGDPKPNNLGRDTIQLSLCWDDWENGGRAQIEKLMAR
ncbi:unnamed protein product [Peniophora sp. CBMAI 1063]|nr:unnamed protein product [Peniophora sp. CBMAI 1063]